MGKYTKIIAGLTKKPEEPRFRAAVEAVKAQIDPQLSSGELGREVLRLRAEKKEKKQEGDRIQEQLTAYEQALTTALRGDNLSSIKLASGESLTLQQRPSATVTDKALFRSWCISHGYEEALTLPPQTTTGVVASLLEEGEPEPPGVKLHVVNLVVLRKT